MPSFLGTLCLHGLMELEPVLTYFILIVCQKNFYEKMILRKEIKHEN